MARMSRTALAIASVLLVCTSHSTRLWSQGTGAGAGRIATLPNAIVGRVLDPAGHPIQGTFVAALVPRQDARRFSPVDVRLHALTNERGEFRLDGLYFGEFYIVALPHNPPLDATRHLNRSGYATTFYPSALSLADAKTLRVTTGGPPTADITLIPARVSTISGTVIASGGQPASGGTCGLAHGDGLFGLDARAVVIRPDGTFVAPALQPGTYFLQLREGTWPPPRNEIPSVSGARVLLADHDVTDVRVVPIHMVRATGRIVVDPSLRGATNWRTVEIAASPIDFEGNPGPQRPGTVKDDLTFEFRTWPTAGRIRVFPEAEWSIKGIRLNGRDITGAPIEFGKGRDIGGLEVEIARGAAGRQ
jgi:hypothetical protein